VYKTKNKKFEDMDIIFGSHTSHEDQEELAEMKEESGFDGDYSRARHYERAEGRVNVEVEYMDV
jgi:hypothetical protein